MFGWDRWKCNRKAVSSVRYVLEAEWPRFGDQLSQLLGPGDPHAAVLESLGEQLPFCLDETHGGTDRNQRTVEGGADSVDLPAHAVGDLGSVPAADIDPKVRLGPSANISMFDYPGVVLGVDHPHPG